MDTKKGCGTTMLLMEAKLWMRKWQRLTVIRSDEAMLYVVDLGKQKEQQDKTLSWEALLQPLLNKCTYRIRSLNWSTWLARGCRTFRKPGNMKLQWVSTQELANAFPWRTGPVRWSFRVRFGIWHEIPLCTFRKQRLPLKDRQVQTSFPKDLSERINLCWLLQ